MSCHVTSVLVCNYVTHIKKIVQVDVEEQIHFINSSVNPE